MWRWLMSCRRGWANSPFHWRSTNGSQWQCCLLGPSAAGNTGSANVGAGPSALASASHAELSRLAENHYKAPGQKRTPMTWSSPGAEAGKATHTPAYADPCTSTRICFGSKCFCCWQCRPRCQPSDAKCAGHRNAQRQRTLLCCGA